MYFGSGTGSIQVAPPSMRSYLLERSFGFLPLRIMIVIFGVLNYV